MIFTTYGGTVTRQDIEREHEEERQALIKKYEDRGYLRLWAEVKADSDIKAKHEASIEALTPLQHISPLD